LPILKPIFASQGLKGKRYSQAFGIFILALFASKR
jgi:hypothetical protein